MNPYIAAALAEMHRVTVSDLEHPGDTALLPSSCRFLYSFISAFQARNVLEFGSGFSSLMIARAISQFEGGRLISIDDSETDSLSAKAEFENSGENVKAVFRTAPLRPRLYGPRLLLSYSLPKGLLGALGPFDLIFIDPPHKGKGRESVLYDVFPSLSTAGYVIIDDANGANAELMRIWDEAYGDAIKPVVLEGIGNGLGVIEKLADTEPFIPARNFLSCAADTIGESWQQLRLRRAR